MLKKLIRQVTGHVEANSDVLQDGPRSEREDSDFDEVLELDFETSVSGDEGRNVESNILHGSLNLRIHRRGDSTRETGAYGSCGSPSSSSQNGVAYQVHICIFVYQSPISAGPEAANVFEAMESNQRKLCRNRETFLADSSVQNQQREEEVDGTFGDSP
ncbi:hypothetical protein V6N11_003699 [Hibiscus sabdariffa]|uniref:Uncharacterized protein n=1 Tax=Hibiscus sabdariffa TaxID=183260 RepID=A0ABR2SEN5_9ROSI